MRKKKQEQEEVAGPTATASRRITPIDVQQKEFRLAFRGYNERDVDAFLDVITEEFALYVEENRRLREGATGAAAPAVIAPLGAADTADASREAADILARAREEAKRIVRDAEARTAAAGVTSTPGDQGAVAPFLNKEREFLQSLAGLVQGHAETVKVMVRDHRERTSAPAPSSPVRVPDAPKEATEAVPNTLSAPWTPESANAAAAAADVADDAAAPTEATRPARSLRELFWGED
jgi:DivIVA domain-containing protein